MAQLRDSFVGLAAPPLTGGEWLQGGPISLTTLRDQGQLALLHFFSSACPASLRTAAVLRSWWRDYQHAGLVIVSIHAPEFAFEHDTDQLRRTLAQQDMTWPTVHDRSHEIWDAYDVQSWPRLMLINPDGLVVADEITEGALTQIEQAIQPLLLRRGAQHLPPLSQLAHQHRLGMSCYPASPELQLGHRRGTLKNREARPDHRTAYRDPRRPAEAGASLAGTWQYEAERVTHWGAETPGHLSIVFSGLGVALVAASRDDRPIELVTTLNGRPVPAGYRGVDTIERHGQTILRVDEPRLYQVVRTTKHLSPAELRLIDTSGRFAAYAAHFYGCAQD